jgi:hypothetical protein
MYFVILNTETSSIMIHDNIVTTGIRNIFPVQAKTKANNIPDKAPAGPYILCLLDANNEANIPA